MSRSDLIHLSTQKRAGDLIATNHALAVHDSGAQRPKPRALEALPLNPPMNHAMKAAFADFSQLSFLTLRRECYHRVVISGVAQDRYCVDGA
jgi:hypothetical protein